jgi:hypothetical protein
MSVCWGVNGPRSHAVRGLKLDPDRTLVPFFGLAASLLIVRGNGAYLPKLQSAASGCPV